VTIKKKNIAKLASLSALGASAAAITAKSADAAIVYTSFSPPQNTVGFSAGSYFYVPQVAAGFGGFAVFTSSKFKLLNNNPPHSLSYSGILKIAISGLNGLQFQEAPGLGAMWVPSVLPFSYKALRSKRTFFKISVTSRKYFPGPSNSLTKTSTKFFPHYFSNSTVLQDRQGEFFLLFQFNPTGSQTDYGWLRLNALCNCGLDTIVVDMAYDDTGAFIQAGASPEPATALPTGLAALALGATGLRRWRKSRKQAA